VLAIGFERLVPCERLIGPPHFRLAHCVLVGNRLLDLATLLFEDRARLRGRVLHQDLFLLERAAPLGRFRATAALLLERRTSLSLRVLKLLAFGLEVLTFGVEGGTHLGCPVERHRAFVLERTTPFGGFLGAAALALEGRAGLSLGVLELLTLGLEALTFGLERRAGFLTAMPLGLELVACLVAAPPFLVERGPRLADFLLRPLALRVYLRCEMLAFGLHGCLDLAAEPRHPLRGLLLQLEAHGRHSGGRLPFGLLARGGDLIVDERTPFPLGVVEPYCPALIRLGIGGLPCVS
jgi:hypothetical protein